MRKRLPINFRWTAFLLVLFLFGISLNAQTNIASQSFEGTGNWNYSPNPATYNVTNDVWDVVTNLSTITPTDGSSFFGMQDLDNTNGGGNFYHTLAFQDIDVVGYTNVSLTFDFNVENYTSTDNIRYVLVIDGVDQTPVDLSNTSSTINIDITTDYPSAQDVAIRIEALQDGDAGIAGVDNFSIAGTLVNTNDLTSTVNSPTSQIAGTTVNANTINTQLNAVDVFRFEIEDAGTTDNLPTTVTNMKFTPGLNNTLLWGDDVQGITLFDGTSYIIPSDVTIDDSELLLEFNDPSNMVIIPDGGTTEFTLGFYINETGIADNDAIQVEINDFGHGFHEDPIGSGFESILSGGSITGNIINVNVEATELQFLQQPTDVDVNDTISPNVQIAFTDENGNVDSTFTGTNSVINLTTNGSTASSATLSAAAIDGIVTFDNLIFDTQQSNINLVAIHGDNVISGSYTSDSFDVVVTPTVIALQDFENTTPEWTYTLNVTPFNSGTGYWGPADVNSITQLDFSGLEDNIFYENDLADNNGNGTTGFGNITFDTVNLENYNNVTLSFDYDIVGYNANDDDAKYEVFYDNVSQGEVFLLDGDSNSSIEDAEGTITINIPNTVDNVELIISIRNDGTDGHSGFDNFTLIGYPDTPQLFVFENNIWTPQNPQGLSDQDDDITIVNGTAIFNQDLEVRDLTVDAGATAEFQEVLKINGDITNNGSIVFKSISETQTGILDEVPATSTISGSGTFTSERYIPDSHRAFRFLSSPITTSSSIRDNWQEGVNNTGTTSSDNKNPNPGYGIHITGSQTGANGFDATPTGNASMFTFDNVTQTWAPISNTNSNTITAGIPYRVYVRGGRDIDVTDNGSSPTPTTLRTTGDIVTGTVIMNDLSDIANNFNFIGNPYQAPVNIGQVLGNSTNINMNQYYIWDPNLGTQGAYVTVSLLDGTNSSGSDANIFIQPGQAVFVTTATTTSTTSVVFEESNKGNQSDLTETFKFSNNDLNITGQLYTQESFNTGGNLHDSFRIRFSNNYSNSVELNDAIKPFNIDENMGIKNGNELFSIESRNLPVDNEEIKLFNNNYRTENYVLSLEIDDFNDVEVYLKDNYTQQTSLLESGTNNISFSVDLNDQSSDENRFSIIFSEDNLNSESNTLDTLAIYPNPLNNGSLFVRLPNHTNSNLEVTAYNMLGQQIYSASKQSINSKIEIKNATTWKNGVYIISINDGTKTVTRKIVKK